MGIYGMYEYVCMYDMYGIDDEYVWYSMVCMVGMYGIGHHGHDDDECHDDGHEWY